MIDEMKRKEREVIEKRKKDEADKLVLLNSSEIMEDRHEMGGSILFDTKESFSRNEFRSSFMEDATTDFIDQIEEQEKIQEKYKDSTNMLSMSSTNFTKNYIGNLGLNNKQDRTFNIATSNPFEQEYGETKNNPIAFIMDERNEDIEASIERLYIIDKSLDREMELINILIGQTAPRYSTKFQQIAEDLKNNLDNRVSATASMRISSRASSRLFP